MNKDKVKGEAKEVVENIDLEKLDDAIRLLEKVLKL